MCPSGRSLGRGGKSTSPSLRSAFEVLDADRDGKISKDDLRAFYGVGGDDDDLIGTMMSVADSNKDGFVQYEEFERVLLEENGKRKKVGPTVLEEAFRVMDKDGDGRLSHDDLKGYMRWAGFDASDDDISAMIRLAAGNPNATANGFVNFDDLVRILSL